MRNTGDKGLKTVKTLLEKSGSPKWALEGEVPREGEYLWGQKGDSVS